MVISSPVAERLRCKKFFMVGKVSFRKGVKLGIVISLLKNLWRPNIDVEIVATSGGPFQCVFDKEVDLQCVLRGNPWYLGKSLVVLSEVKGVEVPADVPLMEQEF